MEENYFNQVPINILGNENLREPQKNAYIRANEYYNDKEYNVQSRESVIILPTGTGKTGLMAILPFGISRKRTLIITPQLTIKKGVLDALTNGPDSFYLRMGLLTSEHTPTVMEYKKEYPFEMYEKTDIVVVNIHKLQERLTKSALNVFPVDFFDLIIVDEAHHSTATTWKTAINYFYNAKVIKLTGTPFRGDGEFIQGVEIFNYPLSVAMLKGYVKSLNNIVYIPDKLYLSIDNEEKLYTIEEILEMKLKDEEWISRSVAYSKECTEQIVKESIKILKEKKLLSELPHKIIAIACSIKHAEDIRIAYESQGCKTAIIHSKLDEHTLNSNFSNIENNRVDVVINVAMLGEGYDHPYLSIAAIFRPFRTLSAYVQFVGRILRTIPNAKDPRENIGDIIVHKELKQDKLWEYYKEEIKRSQIAKKISELEKKGEIINGREPREVKNNDIGEVFEEGIATLKSEPFMDTEILKRAKAEEEKDKERIKKLEEIMGYTSEYAKQFYYAEKSKRENNGLNRPDMILTYNKELLNRKITEEIIPELLSKIGASLEEKTLDKNKIFKDTSYSWITNKATNNGALLGTYINTYLKNKVGKQRGEWLVEDCKIAFKHLEKLIVFLENSLMPKK